MKDPDNGDDGKNANLMPTTTENEWSVIEVNAIADGGNSSSPRPITTSKYTDTQAAILYGMQEIWGKAENTTLYYTKDGKLTENRGEAEDVDSPVYRRPIVVLVTDGRAAGNMVTFNTNNEWWNYDQNPTTLPQTTFGDSVANNTSLYLAATIALWKKVINLNYFGNPDGLTEKNDLMQTMVYTFGMCMDSYEELDPAVWIDPTTAPKTLKEMLEELDPANAEAKAAIESAISTMEDEIKTATEGIAAQNAIIDEQRAIVNAPESTEADKTAAINKMDAANKKIEEFEEALATKFETVLSGLTGNGTALSGSILTNIQRMATARNVAKDYIAGNFGSLGNYLNKRPSGDFKLSNGDLTIEANGSGSFTTDKDAYIDSNGNFPANMYTPTLDDFIYPRTAYAVTDPSELLDVFDDLLADLVYGDVFTVVDGTNSAGFSDSLTYSDPIGDYMTVDDVTYVTMFGHIYEVGAPTDGSKGIYSGQNLKLEDLPKYIGDYLVATKNDSQEKLSNTTFTLYQIVAELTEHNKLSEIAEARATLSGDELTSRLYELGRRVINPENRTLPSNATATDEQKSTSRIRTNESTGETFDLIEGVRIWVEETGEWRDSFVGDFVVDNAYSTALYINISISALPTQIATVEVMYNDDGTTTPNSYTTNLNDPLQSTPLRVFYEVSMHPDNLRYLEKDKGEKNKENAVGVALSGISPIYLEKNTANYIKSPVYGHYVKDGSADAGRYVAFQTNYFTDSKYDDYPIVSDDVKTSRGNAVVSFSPARDNQFYRFKKNRVLYLIPGADESFGRPAEIDLGYLNDPDYMQKYYEGYSENDPKWDPTDVHGLLNILNTARIEKKTTYSNYDCIAVTGEHYTTIKPNGSNAGSWTPTENAGVETGAFVLTEQISSDNWYYIVREFYYPEYEGSNNMTKNVNVRYIAIPRKGSEFGSGLAAGGDMGSEVEWYYPGDEAGLENFGVYVENEDGELVPEVVITNTVDFVSDKDSHYGHPFEWDTVSNKPKDENNDNEPDVNHGTGWYVSAKPGGLRVGGMANFAGVKGFDIREGVSEGNFDKTDPVDDAKLKASNVTSTAMTFFLPTISASESGIEDVTGAVVNAYLGNNGRILVPDEILAVTKQVNTAAGDDANDDDDTDDNGVPRKYDFRIEIKDFYGERGAVIITQDEFDPSLWRRRYETIDVLTDYRSLLLGDDNNLALMTLDNNDKEHRVVRMEVVDENGTTQKEDSGNTKYVYYRAKKEGDEVIKYAKDDAEELKVVADGSAYKLVKVSNRKVTDVDISGTDYKVSGGEDWTRDNTGVIVPDMNQQVDVDNLYYVYVGMNLRNDFYDNNKTLCVFKADADLDENGHVTKNEDGSLSGLKDIYGNESWRGGRTYYLSETQLDALDPKVTTGKSKETGFEFHKITADDERDGYVPGDREFWINKVIFIPISKVDDTSWETTIRGYENYADNGGDDWRLGYESTDVDQNLLDALNSSVAAGAPKFRLREYFKVAYMRTANDGATTDTTLGSDNGYYLESKFLTTSADFKACTEHDHGEDSYGYTTFKLTTGQGLGFNNIHPGSHYMVTEILSPEQVGQGIRFEQAEHVQDNLLRTTYTYTTDPGSTVTTVKEDLRYASFGATIADEWYWDKSKLGTNVAIRESHQGDDYFWKEGQRVLGSTSTPDDTKPVTADFSKATQDNSERRYTVVGTTSPTEQAVHYVNFQPTIKKWEFTPGEGESVYTGDYITYGIRWENFAYSAEQGKAQEAEVTITDVLDPGVDFISAVFNPYHGNITDINTDNNTDNNKRIFNAEDFEKEYKELLKLREEEEQLTARENQLKKRQEELNDNIKDLESAISDLQDKINSLVVPEDPAEEEEPEVADPEIQKATLKAELDSLEAQIAEKQAELDNLQTLQAEKQAKLTDLEAQKSEMQAEIGDLEAQKAALQAELDYLETLQDELADLEARKAALQAELDDLKIMQAELEDLEAGQAALQAELDDMEDEQDEQLADLEAQLAELQDKLKAAEAELARVETNLKSAQTDLETTKSQMGDLETKWHDKTDAPDPLAIILTSVNGTTESDGSISRTYTYYYRDSDVSSEMPKVGDLAEVEENGNKVRKMTVKVKYTPYAGDPIDKEDPNNPDKNRTGGTVTWTITNAPASTYGYVELKVRVNAHATQDWDYDEEDGTLSTGAWSPSPEDKDNQVINGASVRAGNITRVTNTIKNPTGENTKTEITPGNGMQVIESDELFYEIGWANSTEDVKKIVIQDRLDPGVYFSKAWIMEGAGRADDVDSFGRAAVSIPDDASMNSDSSEISIFKRMMNLNEDSVESGVTEEPGASQEPTATEESGASQEPTATEESDVSQEPTATEESGASQEPTATEESDAIQEPGTTEALSATQASDNDFSDDSNVEPDGTNSGIQSAYNTGDSRVIASDNRTGITKDSITLVIEDGDETGNSEDTAIAADDEKERKIGSCRWDDEEAVALKSEGLITLGDETVPVTIEYDPKSHTITWTLENVPALYSGRVYFSVFVNDYADYEWKNRDEGDWKEDADGKLPAPDVDKDDKSPDNEDDRIYNQARIGIPVIKNDKEVMEWGYTNTVENPTHPAKDEVIPGNGKTVMVGQQITYTITWLNDAVGKVGTDDEGKPIAADVTIIDILDPGVKFIDAGFVNEDGEYVPTLGEGESKCEATHKLDSKGIGTVTWTLPNQDPRATGMVYLIVEVNEKAFERWNYVVNDSAPDHDDWTYEITPGEGQDDQVVNKARVIVEGGSDQFTNEVENPVTKPKKEEITPGDGKTVKVEKEITYRITWKNYTYDEDGNAATADVVVTDMLDPGVTFVSASYENVTLNAASDGSSVETSYGDITVSYNKGTHTVEWVLKNRVGESEGYVDLTVKVNKAAFEDWHYRDADGTITQGTGGPGKEPQVVNKAGVKVGNHHTQYTEVVKNPVEEEPPTTPTTPDTPSGPDNNPDPDNNPGPGNNPDPNKQPVPKTGDESNLVL